MALRLYRFSLARKKHTSPLMATTEETAWITQGLPSLGKVSYRNWAFLGPQTAIS
jgi:hypothetical protein